MFPEKKLQVARSLLLSDRGIWNNCYHYHCYRSSCVIFVSLRQAPTLVLIAHFSSQYCPLKYPFNLPHTLPIKSMSFSCGILGWEKNIKLHIITRRKGVILFMRRSFLYAHTFLSAMFIYKKIYLKGTTIK